jgi:hypothetical protein
MSYLGDVCNIFGKQDSYFLPFSSPEKNKEEMKIINPFESWEIYVDVGEPLQPCTES